MSNNKKLFFTGSEDSVQKLQAKVTNMINGHYADVLMDLGLEKEDEKGRQVPLVSIRVSTEPLKDDLILYATRIGLTFTECEDIYYRIYGKQGNAKRFKAMDYSSGELVTNLIYATNFEPLQKEELEAEVKYLNDNNPEFTFELREVKL